MGVKPSEVGVGGVEGERPRWRSFSRFSKAFSIRASNKSFAGTAGSRSSEVASLTGVATPPCCPAAFFRLLLRLRPASSFALVLQNMVFLPLVQNHAARAKTRRPRVSLLVWPCSPSSRTTDDFMLASRVEDPGKCGERRLGEGSIDGWASTDGEEGPASIKRGSEVEGAGSSVESRWIGDGGGGFRRR